MGKSRFEHFIADKRSIDIQIVDTQPHSHPFCALHLSFIGQRGHKPTGTVCRTRTIVYDARHDRSIGHRNPL